MCSRILFLKEYRKTSRDFYFTVKRLKKLYKFLFLKEYKTFLHFFIKCLRILVLREYKISFKIFIFHNKNTKDI